MAGFEPARAEALAASVQDFRDADDTPRPNGAEDGDYAGAGLPHGAKDAPFEAVEELHQVFGMTRELYAAVAGAVTVHARTRRPDAKVAPPLVIAALRGGGGGAAPPATLDPGGILAQPPSRAPMPGADVPGVVDPNVAVLYLGPIAHRSRSRTFTTHA